MKVCEVASEEERLRVLRQVLFCKCYAKKNIRCSVTRSLFVQRWEKIVHQPEIPPGAQVWTPLLRRNLVSFIHDYQDFLVATVPICNSHGI